MSILQMLKDVSNGDSSSSSKSKSGGTTSSSASTSSEKSKAIEKITEEYNKNKKRKSFLDVLEEIQQEQQAKSTSELAEVTTSASPVTETKTAAPIEAYFPWKGQTMTPAPKKEDPKWYESGLFEDGYDFGDVTKTILGISDKKELKDFTAPETEDSIEVLKQKKDYYDGRKWLTPEQTKESLKVTQQYNQMTLSQYADTLSKTQMDGQSHTVLEEIEILANMKSGKEKDERKAKVLAKMEELGMDTSFYSHFAGDGEFDWGTFGKWITNSAMAGLNTFNKGLLDTADVLLGAPLKKMGWENNPISEGAEYYDDLYETYRYNANLMAEKLGGNAWNFGTDTIEGTVGALPNALLMFMTGGQSATATTSTLVNNAAAQTGNILTKAGLTTEAMLKNPQYWMSFARELGSEYKEAKELGASDTAAAVGSVLKSFINSGIEIGTDGGSGIQGLGDALKDGGKPFWEWLESSIEEGGEEVLQKFVGEVINKFGYGSDQEILNPIEYAKEGTIGMLSGMALGGGQTAVQTGVNAVAEHQANKLTDIEKAVKDKIVQNRIAQKEKDGKTLTAKEKADIENDVDRNLRNGYLKAEEIEDAIGGEAYEAFKSEKDNFFNSETYKNYKNDSKRIEKLKKQLEEADGQPNTVGNAKRYENIQNRLNILKARNDKAKATLTAEADRIMGMRGQMRAQMMETVKDSRLYESYNELARKQQKFETDVSKYTNENAKKTVQSILDSGLGDNSRQFHDTVDWLAKLSEERNVTFDLTKTERLKGTEHYKEGYVTNGFKTTIDGKTNITVNLDGNYLNTTVGHEITHVLEEAGAYKDLADVVKAYAIAKEGQEGYNKRIEDVKEIYGDDQTAIDSEITADIIGEYLFTDYDFVQKLTENRNVFKKFWDEIKYLYKIATADSREARELEKVKKMFDKAWRESIKGKSEAKTESKATIAPENDANSDTNQYSMTKASDEYADPFYSHMAKVVDGVKQAKLGATSVVNMLRGKGVKAEEIKWSGIEEWLEGKKSVTKAELQEFVNGSMLQIEEETRGGDAINAFVDEWRRLMDYDVSTEDVVVDENFLYDVADVLRNAVEEGNLEQDEMDRIMYLAMDVRGQPSKWDDYKLDGGSNYRELVFKMPNSEYSNESMRMHWGEDAEGVLAHARMQDFETPSGKMLFIEEIQSDWHNEGHKSGYNSNEAQKNAEAKREAYRKLKQRLKADRDLLLNDLTEFYRSKGYDTPVKAAESELSWSPSKLELFRLMHQSQNMPSELMERFDEYHSGLDEMHDLGREEFELRTRLETGVPDAPFHNNYHEYVLKRLIREAAEKGYDSIGWTTADMQSKRWSEEYAEGYRIEYDQDIPKFLSKYGKKWGATVSKTDIQTKQLTLKQELELSVIADILEDGEGYIRKERGIESVWTMPITDAMKKSVLYEGQTMYSMTKDSTGRELSAEQQEFFKDTKIVDENGNLMTMYHGTKRGGFTVFDGGKDYWYFTNNKKYADTFEGRDQNGEFYPSVQEGIDEGYFNPQNYEVYLNVTKPFITDDIDIIEDALYWDRSLPSKLREQGYDALMLEDMSQVIVLNQNQIKNATNQNPTDNPDIRYSMTKDTEGRELTAEQSDFFKDTQVKDADGNLKVVYHGSPADFNTFSLDYLGTNGTAEGYGFYFTDKKSVAEGYVNSYEVDNGDSGKLFEVYLDIKKPLSNSEVTMTKAQFKKFLTKLNGYVDSNGDRLDVLSNYGDVEWEGLNTVLNYALESEYDYCDNDVDLIQSIINGCGDMKAVFDVLRQTVGYDGIIVNEASWGGDQTIYIAFHPEQIKNVDNLNPTSNPDIRYSISKGGKSTSGDWHIDGNFGYTEDFADFAPVREDATTSDTETVADNMKATGEAPVKDAPVMDAPIREDAPKKSNAKPKSEESIRAEQRKLKNTEHTSKWERLIGNTATWKDMSTGLAYKTKTLRRILRKVVRDASGNPDIKRADAIYDELETKYDHNEAILKRESAKLKEGFQKLNLNHAEDEYAQMLGELRYNPETTLTEDVVKEYLKKHKGRINEEKVNKAIKDARKLYDDLLVRVNEVLREQGFKEIPYRQGYFPHFTNPKQNWFQKMMNWKVIDNEIPTSIAGLTEMFKPNRSWQSFNKQRTGDKTDYSLYQGLDTYIHGALDWIYHIDDLQSRRALENLIRYTHSDKGIQERIDAIKESNLDAEETQKQIDAVLAEANNPLSGLVRELMNRTNTLANKKSSMDRGVEDMMNRKIYSTMTNLNNRITGNQVVGSLSSAMTNFIPMVQSWHQVSPVYTLKGLGNFVRSTIKDDGMVAKSDFLTNRLMEEEKLYQTGWDKVSDKAAFMMNIADQITSQTVWRSKYYQNLHEGMSEAMAIKDADQFCKNLMAGRSRGNAPTIFDAKNPFVKVFTAFQLEVANQYGYMFDDVPKDSKNVVRLVKGYATAFFGAYMYNALYSSLVGRDAAFDPIKIIEELMSGLLDDEEENEDVLMDFGENVLEQMPYIGGLLGGGRIPISSAFPYSNYDTPFQSMLEDFKEGKDDGNWTPLIKEMLKPLYYIAMPTAGGQIKKTNEGLAMFSDEHPIPGSYTASGNLRFPVEDTFGSRVQAALFGQYSSENARKYFDEERSVLYPDQIEIFKNLDMPIEEYWEYRDNYDAFKGLKDELKDIANSDTATVEDILKSKYASAIYSDLYGLYDEQKAIANGDSVPLSKKIQVKAIQEQMSQMLDNVQSDIDNMYVNGYYATIGDKRFDYSDYSHKWYEISGEYLEKEQKTIERFGITPDEYWNNQDKYYHANNYFETKYEDKSHLLNVSKVVFNGKWFADYASEVSQIRGEDLNGDGKTDSNSKKKNVFAYIDSLNVSDIEKKILRKMSYPSEKTYNKEIVSYIVNLNVSKEAKKKALESLTFTIDADGWVDWEQKRER